jgi:hypothetical protein
MESFSEKPLVRRSAFAAAAIAGLAVAGLALAQDVPARSSQNLGNSGGENRLVMNIGNQSSVPMNYANSRQNIHSYPDSIAPGTWAEVKAANNYVEDSHGDQMVSGHITYNAPDSSTCQVTLEFYYLWTGNRCKDRSFTLTTKSGTCTLARSGSCYTSNDCKCNFVFNS